LTSIGRWPGGLAIVVCAALLYGLAHAVMRLLISGNLGEDDGRNAVLLQELRLVWWAKQPPLYDWLLAGLQSVLGPTLLSFLILKYVLLVLIAGLVYLIARRILDDPWWALLTVEALGLIYQLSWRFHEGFTNAVGAMATSLALVLTLLHVVDRGRTREFVWLGIAGGLAMLTSLSGHLVAAALAIAVAVLAPIRSKVFQPPLVLSGCIVFLVASPYLLWLIAEPVHMVELVTPTPDEIAISLAGRTWLSFVDALRGPVFALSPLLLILPIAFPGLIMAWWRVRLAWSLDAVVGADLGERLIAVYSLVVWGLLLVVLPLAGQPGIATHTQLPFFLPTVVWLMAQAKRACRSSREAVRFSAIALGVAAFAFVLRAANLVVLDPVCGTCRWAQSYDELATAIRAAGFEQGTIIALDNDIAGNLRRYFPHARMRSNAAGWFVPRETPDSVSGTTVYVWSGRFPADFALRIGEAYLGPRIVPLMDKPEVVRASWHYLYPRQTKALSEWRFVLVR
jgi:hypothetical protein